MAPQVKIWQTVKLAPAWQERDRNLPCVLEALYPRLDLTSSYPPLLFFQCALLLQGGLEKVPDGQ